MHIGQAALTSIAYGLGTSRLLPVYFQAPLAPGVEQLPVIIFSHGLAGTRNAYSSICIELASQGYVVMALEHSDGSASTARLPRLARGAAASTGTTANGAAATTAAPVGAGSSGGGAGGSDGDASGASTHGGTEGRIGMASGFPGSGGGVGGDEDLGSEWCWYGGMGDKAAQLAKTRHRVAEVQAAYLVLRMLHEGRGEGVRELPAAVAAGLRGRLGLGRAALIGHSYGGATVAGAASQLPIFKAAICLDPWWDCFPEDWSVLTQWTNPAPLLVIGSQDWNTPGIDGKIKCGGDNQERVLAAAAAGGGGAVLAVPRGSGHGSFDDVLLLFGKAVMWMLRTMNFKAGLEPRLAHRINMWCITHFLNSHLPPASMSEAAPAAAVPAASSGKDESAGAAAAAAEAVLTPVGERTEAAFKEGFAGEHLHILRTLPGRVSVRA